MQINHDTITIYFGTKEFCIHADQIELENFLPVHEKLKIILQTQSLYFCKQVHGVQGFYITPEFVRENPAFCKEGDFLYTSEKLCAIGVITADCLPIVLHHPQGIINIIHAGWKGSFENILEKAISDMIKSYTDIKIHKLEMFLGPSGKNCCYQVQKDFMGQFIAKYPWSSAFFMLQDEKIYFDNPGFTVYVAQKIGILPENIYTKWNLCTICDKNYCSYRREGVQAGRNITLVMRNA